MHRPLIPGLLFAIALTLGAAPSLATGAASLPPIVPTASTEDADITDADGRVTLSAGSKNLSFRVIDESGETLSEVIAVLKVEDGALGSLLLVDPIGRFAPKVVLLRGKRKGDAASSAVADLVLYGYSTIEGIEGLVTTQLKKMKKSTALDAADVLGHLAMALPLVDDVAVANEFPSIDFAPKASSTDLTLKKARKQLKKDLKKATLPPVMTLGFGTSGAWFHGGAAKKGAVSAATPGAVLLPKEFKLAKSTAIECLQKTAGSSPITRWDLGFARVYACNEPAVTSKLDETATYTQDVRSSGSVAEILSPAATVAISCDKKVPASASIVPSLVTSCLAYDAILVSQDAVGEAFRIKTCEDSAIKPGAYRGATTRYCGSTADGPYRRVQNEVDIPADGAIEDLEVPLPEVNSWEVSIHLETTGYSDDCQQTVSLARGGSKVFQCGDAFVAMTRLDVPKTQAGEIRADSLVSSDTVDTVALYGFGLDEQSAGIKCIEVDVSASGPVQSSGGALSAGGPVSGSAQCDPLGFGFDNFNLTGSFSATATP